MNREELQETLRRRVAADRLDEAIDGLLSASRGAAFGEFRTRVLAQEGQLSYLKRLRQSGTQDFADLVRTRNQLGLNLLDLIGELPAEGELTALEEKKKTGVAESTVRAWLFRLLVVGKLTVIGYLFLLWRTGSNVTREQFFVTLGVIVPMFAAHLTLMVGRSTDDRYLLVDTDDKLLRSNFAQLTYGLAITYPLLLLFFLYLLGPGDIDFTEMNVGLGITEATLGAWLGKVVTGVVKK